VDGSREQARADPGTELVIYDIGMRMLVPRELFRANGFRDDYVIDLDRPEAASR
jgi:hypothetical protein